MTNMRVFQIQKGEILIINGDKQYSDTVENFKLDSGLSLNNLTEVIYDNYQECSVINKEFKEYPNTEFEGYIDNVDIYIKAKTEREYVPPEEPTEEEKALAKINEIMAANDEQIADIKDAMLVAVLTNDTELQAELKQEYAAVIEDTNNKLQEVKAND
jgi:endo-alpha-1,4-polygalactosaminidase (GH114 family)